MGFVMDALYSLSILAREKLKLCYGDGSMSTNKTDFDLNQQKAKQGDAHAQTLVAISYAKGRGVRKDLQQAYFWYQQAAEQGYAPAQFNLGIMVEYCVSQDKCQAMSWYQKAADQDYAPAQFILGVICESEVPSNESLAAIWYQKAAEQDHPAAQYALGQLYADGRGVPQDDVLAKEWVDKATAQGYDFFAFPDEE